VRHVRARDMLAKLGLGVNVGLNRVSRVFVHKRSP
jgi:hypothetical protein